MITFTKAQIASLLATGVDFLVTFLLVRLAGAPIVAGGATGTICGGVTHFMISRNWVFSAQEGKWAAQVNRYVLVWIGNFLLNVSGLWLFTHYTEIKDLLAKVIVAVAVAVCYNYVLQKRFVFK
ncbi:GtrA family protein [Puia sp.]|jgi:putative flippase GtrA|uniref:GtrA family protein n=1 Tax=Puia sp. TaxID=2045100 RepID=UPI002F406772